MPKIALELKLIGENKAKLLEKAQCTAVHEHFDKSFNAVIADQEQLYGSLFT